MVVSISPFQHMKGKPDIKYVANIHGNETKIKRKTDFYNFVNNYNKK